MALPFDLPECSQTPVGRWDSRWKLAALLPAAIVAALIQTLAPTLVAFGAALALVALARLPVGWYLARLGWVTLFLALFLVWLPFLHPDGLIFAAVLLAKALTVVSLMLVLLATAPLQDSCKAAHALRVPGILVHLVLLTYRYVFLLAEEFARLRIAVRVRGFRNRGDLHSYRTIGQVAGTLLVRGQERAERVSQAMRCRGFDGCFRSLHDFHTTGEDVLGFAVVIGSAAAVLAWDFLTR